MDLPQHCINRTIHMQVPTNNIQKVVSTTVSALRMVFLKEGGYQYKKAGVIVWNIVPDSASRPTYSIQLTVTSSQDWPLP
ncbi:hypothetical protein [Bacteroides cellulosilyticus]|uniref:hypothetical protein n=1 Tax=Bacteroides cellulosilyticus TaxID=246787 RepID=UPI0032EDBBD0